MEQEIKDLLVKNIRLTEENNRLLRNIRTATRLGVAWKVIYLAFFIGSALVAFNFLKPYLTQVQDAYGTIVDTRAQIKDAIHMPR